MLRHPIAKVGALLVVFRLGGLVVRYLAGPDGSLTTRLQLFAPAASAHVGALLIIVALFLLLARARVRVPGFDRAVTTVACIVFAVLMVAGQADLTVGAITGAPLTPTLFRTFRGIHVVRSNEFLEPLRANAGLAGGGLLVFVAVLVWMIRVILRDTGESRAPGAGALATGIALLLVPQLMPWPGPPPPIEVAFAREYLRLDGTTLHASEPDAIRQLRTAIGLPAGGRWVSEEYPLVYAPAPPTRAVGAADRPDLVVIMIESLRAAELAFVTGAGDSVTPHLDALARRSVVFPTFTSNGFPSAPSVLSFHCSAWPHRRKEIITDFADRQFDCLPSRVRGMGYDTIYVGADPHFDNQDRWLGRWYATVVDLVANGIAATDRNIVSRSIEEIQRHDRESREPLFAFVSTYSTHYPFTLPDDAGEPPAASDAGLRERYRRVVQYTDREVGRLLAFLAARSRHDGTVTIVVGDHGFYTDLRRTSGLPENDNVWTAAIINGPRELIGEPRRIVGPASHVDMLPTVLDLVGDARPTASLGGSLFRPPRGGKPSAVAIRPGGLRFDRDGYAVLLDARMPNVAAPHVAFPGLVPAGDAAAVADVTAERLTDWITDWSYLIEKNRVWNDAFLTRR